MFVDSDDYLEKNALELLIKKSNGVEIVIGGVKRTTINNTASLEDCIFENEKKSELIKSVFQAKSGRYSYVDGLWGKIYRKDFWKNNELKLERNLKYGEDATLNIEAYIKATKISFFSKVIYYWRTNDESVTARYNPSLMDEQEKVLNMMKYKYPQITDELFQEEFISYVSKTIKNVIENIFLSKENTKKRKKDLLKRMVDKPIYNECINSNMYKEVSTNRKIILILLRLRMFFIIEILFKMYKKTRKSNEKERN